MTAVVIRGTAYPVVLPKLSDPRLHLAATIVSLQVIGQVGFHFQLSIAQILISLGTCAVLEVAIAFHKQHVLMWPASALLTGNGVAFILRVPDTRHGDWWSTKGWWIFAGTAAVSLLSKYVIKWRGNHIFNPSNIGLVVCFLLLGRGRANPLDFWWGPMSLWLVLALAVILAGGFVILSRLKLLWIAVSFWITFAAAIGVIALGGHEMSARWHLGPITGFSFWWVLVTSPEVLVFLFFMITDPKTAPKGARARIGYGIALGLLSALLIAGARTEFASKVALLGSLVIVCIAMPLLPLLRRMPWHVSNRRLAGAVAGGIVVYVGALVSITGASPSSAAPPTTAASLPAITILPSRGVQTQLNLATAEQITHGLVAAVPVHVGDGVRVWLEPGVGQSPPIAVAQLAGVTYRLEQTGFDWVLSKTPASVPAREIVTAPVPRGHRLTNVASVVGLNFQQGSFRFGTSNDYRAMMGGGVCWVDYNNDGWLDLFAVNSYASADAAGWETNGGLPRTALFENVHGSFRDIGRQAHADLAVQGDGCVAADLNGDGRTDLLVTTTSGVDLLWNQGDGTFAEGARAAGLNASGWYTGAAVADVNGDGRPDVFVAGYADPNEPVPNSVAGFPTNLAGIRDLLYLNDGNDSDGHARFREVGVAAGLESAAPRHGLGAVFTDYNGDGRPDLYVADDEDPNQLYENIPWPGGVPADPAGLGFRFEERGGTEGVADGYAGMGIATTIGANGRPDLFVTNSRNEPSAAFRGLTAAASPAFADARPTFDQALGTGFAGWGASWVDLWNTGSPDLVLAAGAIPVTRLSNDAEPVRTLSPVAAQGAAPRFGDAKDLFGSGGLRLNGRGLAAADVNNDGHMNIAINTIGGKLVLLRPTGATGHWLDVQLARFSPGALVTVILPSGRRLLREVQAGSSYLSSEDPRLHFGLGRATKARLVTVRYPWGGESRSADVNADQVVTISPPAPVIARTRPDTASYRLTNCTQSVPRGRSVAELWDEAAGAALQQGRATGPVQARDLFHLSAAMWDAWAAFDPKAHGYFSNEKAHATHAQSARDTAISYAAYRLLLWRVSLNANLDDTFALLSKQLRSLCYSPDFTTTAGDSPAALGNRIAASAIGFGRNDGSLEALHYLDTSYVPLNAPLVVSQPGSTVHDATFWQPLAIGKNAARGLAAVPAQVEGFSDSQWGRVRGFALPRSTKGLPIDPGAPPFGVPSSAAYKQAAVAAIRATSARRRPANVDASPVGWNAVAESLSSGTDAAARLRNDVRLLPHAQRRAARCSDRRLGRQARVPVAATDLDDPLPRLQRPASSRSGPDQERRRPAARPPRRPLGPRRALEPARPHTRLALAGPPATVHSRTPPSGRSRPSPATRSPSGQRAPLRRASTPAPSSRPTSAPAAPSAPGWARSWRASSATDNQ